VDYNSVFEDNPKLHIFYQGNNPKSYTFIDMKEIIGNKASALLWTNKYSIESENKEINDYLQNFCKDNDLLAFFMEMEKMVSIYGRVLIILNRTKDGTLKLDISDPYFIYNSRIAYMYRKVVAAQIYTRKYHQDATFAVVEN
jgi:hypothetical protein